MTQGLHGASARSFTACTERELLCRHEWVAIVAPCCIVFCYPISYTTILCCTTLYILCSSSDLPWRQSSSKALCPRSSSRRLKAPSMCDTRDDVFVQVYHRAVGLQVRKPVCAGRHDVLCEGQLSAGSVECRKLSILRQGLPFLLFQPGLKI